MARSILRTVLLAAVLADASAIRMSMASAMRKAIGIDPNAGQKAAVSQYMVKDVMALEASSSLEAAAKQLVEKKIRGAPVVDEVPFSSQ